MTNILDIVQKIDGISNGYKSKQDVVVGDNVIYKGQPAKVLTTTLNNDKSSGSIVIEYSDGNVQKVAFEQLDRAISDTTIDEECSKLRAEFDLINEQLSSLLEEADVIFNKYNVFVDEETLANKIGIKTLSDTLLSSEWFH
jgi:hypothetical protein